MTTRRKFITSILALVAAPAIVKAQNIMPIWIPKKEILVPNKELLLPDIEITLNGIQRNSNEHVTVSMWVKEQNENWVYHTHTFSPTGDTAKIKIPLKQRNQLIYGLQVGGLSAKPKSLHLNVTQDSSIRFDTLDTPYTKCKTSLLYT